MGAEGKPTTVDFSKQYVIAIIKPVTNKAVDLSVQSLTKTGDDIILRYAQAEGEKQSFTTRPFLLLVVDNAYSGNVVTQQQ